MLLDREQGGQPLPLLVGQQVSAGVQGSAGRVEGFALAAAVPVQVLLDPAPAPVQAVTGQADDVEGVHDRDVVGQLLGGGGLEPGEPVHGDNLHPSRQASGRLGQPGLNTCLERPSTMSNSRDGPGPVADRGEVDDDRDELVAAAGVPPDVLIDADHLDAVEAVRVVDQHPLPFGQHGRVGGVP